MPLIGLFKQPGPNGFGYNSTSEEVTAGLDLSGKTYLVTGVNSGLGMETARVLALRGGHVIGAARTLEKAHAALARVAEDFTPVSCDLSEPAMVKSAAADILAMQRPLDAMIFNAGIMALPKRRVHHGLELQFLTNHIGHFVLATGLLDALAEDGRVVAVSSGAHFSAPPEGIMFGGLSFEKGYHPWKSYGHSKLANILFASELARRMEGSGRTANSLHPGVIRTSLVRHMGFAPRLALAVGEKLFLKSIPQGAATQLFLAANPMAADYSGEYFSDCNPAEPSANARDMEMAARLWEVSEQIASRY